jgi:hypothetical protein
MFLGAGLGLTISLSLVGMIGPNESIEIDSKVNLGSEFKFKIF